MHHMMHQEALTQAMDHQKKKRSNLKTTFCENNISNGKMETTQDKEGHNQPSLKKTDLCSQKNRIKSI